MHANLNFEKNDWRVGPDETVQVLNAKEKKLQEFYLGKDETKTNWRSVIFALVVIGTVMIGVLIAVLAMGPLDDAAAWFHIPLTLEDALQQRDSVQSLQVGNAVFMGDSVSFFQEDGGIDVFHPDTDSVKSLVPSSVIRQLNSQKYHPSWDQKFVLLLHDEAQQDGGWRRCYKYSIFVTSDNYHIPLRISTAVATPPHLQCAKWAGRSSGLLLVWNNNIYYSSSPLEDEPTKLTFDGGDHVLNGISDWLYHESMGLSDLLWPSENGEYLIFGRIDNSRVGEEEFVLFGSSPRSYQKANTLRYPKVGTTLPEISLVLVRLSDREKIAVIYPSNITGSDSYLRTISWSGDESVTIAWTSRAHNITAIIACSAPDFVCKEIYVERTRAKNEWLTTPHFIPSRTGKEEILFIDEVSDHRGVVTNQILHVRSPQQRATPLKHEGVSVVSLIGWDETEQKVYFTGSPDARPFERHIYGVTDANNTEISTLFCLTCSNETDDDETLPFSCSFFHSVISSTYNYMIAECLGPTVPYTTVYQLHDGSVLKELNKNNELRKELLEGIKWRERRYEFDLADGSVGHLQLLLPLKWKDSIHGRIQFPLIIEVPENPEDFEVASKWRRGFDMYQALGLQSAYARISGRERRHTRGAVLLAAQDVITMVRALLEEVRFIDEDRITIWGKGFGGYVATAVMASGNKEVSCGAAVAPVTDWLSQDAASSEQYLGLVAEEYQSYVIGDLSRVAENIPHNSYLLIHGSFSDPVHMQQSMSLAKALSQAGIQFHQQILPDADYLLKSAERQIYVTVNDFLHSCYRRSITQS